MICLLSKADKHNMLSEQQPGGEDPGILLVFGAVGVHVQAVFLGEIPPQVQGLALPGFA